MRQSSSGVPASPSGYSAEPGPISVVPAVIPNASWLILSEQNIAIRFERHGHHIDFWVFSASYTTHYLDGKTVLERWELDDCGDSWPLEEWRDAFWQIWGGIKWDGCINWESNPGCMVHGCGVRHIAHIGAQFNAIYAYAKRFFDLLGDEAPPMPEPFIELPDAIAMEAATSGETEGLDPKESRRG